MFDKIRLTLWDIYTFFITGIVIWSAVIFYSYLFHIHLLRDFASNNLQSLLGFNLLTILTMILFVISGLVFEPFSNYLHRSLLDVSFKKIYMRNNRSKKESIEREVFEKKIISYYQTEIGIKVEPYQIVKEYVDMKQINNSWMTFLSRFGFYRNLSSLTFLFGLILTLEVGVLWQKALWFGICLFMSYIFYSRAKEFYSYMAPSIYRSFLNERLLK